MNISTVPHRSDREAIGGLKGSNFASATGNVVCDDCRAWRHSSGPVVRENGPDRAHVHLPDSGAEPPKLGGGIGVMYIRAGKRVASYIGAVVANAVGAIVRPPCRPPPRQLRETQCRCCRVSPTRHVRRGVPLCLQTTPKWAILGDSTLDGVPAHANETTKPSEGPVVHLGKLVPNRKRALCVIAPSLRHNHSRQLIVTG